MNIIDNCVWYLGGVLYFIGQVLDEWSDDLQSWALRKNNGQWR